MERTRQNRDRSGMLMSSLATKRYHRGARPILIREWDYQRHGSVDRATNPPILPLLIDGRA